MSKSIALLCAAVLAFGLAQLRLSAQESSTTTLTRSEAHVVFDQTAFFGPETPVPHWANGYLISFTVETFAPDSPNVRLYDKTGGMVRSATVWFPGSTRVALTSATAGPHGEIIASGEADSPDGARPRFIVSVNAAGKMTALQTADFDPDQVCAAPDGTIWSFGGSGWDSKAHRPEPGETFRHFDMQRGQIGAYVPRSAFPDWPAPYELSYMSCGANQIAVYSPTGVYIEMSYGSDAPRVYKVSMPAGYGLHGLVIQGPKRPFGLLQKYTNHNLDVTGVNGLYSLDFNEANSTARWVPVPGAAGSYNIPGMPARLYGMDGDNLVVTHSKDNAPGSLHWDALSPRE
jgi:hypothetical protein